MSINFQFNVKRKFTVNGVEYGSLEEMPPELRAAVEKAAAGKTGVTFSAAACASVQKTGGGAKITVNGRTYDGVEAMPEEDRKLYEQAMGAVHAESAPALPSQPAHAPLLREKPRDDRKPLNRKGCGFFLFALGSAGLLAWLAATRGG